MQLRIPLHLKIGTCDVFHFAELSTYIANLPSRYCKLGYWCPKQEAQAFGSLFEINESDEISHAVQQLMTLKLLTQLPRIKATGDVVTASSTTVQGVVSGTSYNSTTTTTTTSSSTSSPVVPSKSQQVSSSSSPRPYVPGGSGSSGY